MKTEFTDGDIIIRKATNGWVVIKRNIWPEDESEETILVYEDDDTEWGQQEAFARLLRDNFFELVQSKKRGGITLQIAEKGYGEE